MEHNPNPDEYVKSNALNPDVFFSDSKGNIKPGMRQEWIQMHEAATENPGIDYDKISGVYNFCFKLHGPISLTPTEKRGIRARFDNTTTSVEFTKTGVFAVGTVQNPGTATMISDVVLNIPNLSAK